MNSIQFGWIDYSSEHRDKVMAVLQALLAPGAVDELGIGQIRDGFANLFFPGTSTIQTRAKYFFIVPYILMELEQKYHLKPEAFQQELDKMELDLIEPLKKTGENVIGERAGRNLKRKPSSIYWHGLRTFGIFRYPNLSLGDYMRAISAVNREKAAQRAMGLQTGEKGEDDCYACLNPIPGGFWQCLQPKQNWRENVTINLTAEEAVYLKQRIRKAPLTRDSLLAYLLEKDPEIIRAVSDMQDIGRVFDLPVHIKPLYAMAMGFANFIYGATLRYNVILSDGENQKAVEGWRNWCKSEFVTHFFADYDPNETVNYLKINNYRLRRFLGQWHKAYLSGDLNKVDDIIIKREIEIKSRSRAKLRNPALYVYREGDGMRGGKLGYRYGNARVILLDIFEGLSLCVPQVCSACVGGKDHVKTC